MGWREVWAVDDGLGNSCRLGDVKKKGLAGDGWGILFTVPCLELSMRRAHTVIQFFIGMVSLVSHTIAAFAPHQPVHRVGVSYAVASACLAVPSFAA